ncbi:MAG: ATP-binding protein [Candidatus Lokiarchaeota archaeon]
MSELGKSIGSFIGGSFNELFFRKKSGLDIEIGQLLVAGKNKENYSIYQINDLLHGSQIPESSIELIAGYKLEREKSNLEIYEPELRNYVLAKVKPLIEIKDGKPILPKKLPEFLGEVYEIEEFHLNFLQEKEIDNPITIGKVRSGSKVLDIDVSLEATEILDHHILIPATTGRGKSNLVKVVLFNLIDNENVGKLILDPHNEYYETLKQHPNSLKQVKYYTVRDIHGKLELEFNVNLLTPEHIMGSISLSNAQSEALVVYYREDRENGYNDWIRNIFTSDPAPGVHPSTIEALRRKLSILLDIEYFTNDSGELDVNPRGIYTLSGSETIINDIIKYLKEGKTVIVDTSLFTGNEEIFIATIILNNVFSHYRRAKFNGTLENLPVITTILEEAPRVIGKKVLDVSDNIFGTIAKEGRKFNNGMVAITQLPSIIEREILANMNTKIILGNEMGPERMAIINSAAQDLSESYQAIGSLDKGEAIITSNFTKFAIPIKIPLIDDLIMEFKSMKEKTDDNTVERSPF